MSEINTGHSHSTLALIEAGGVSLFNGITGLPALQL